MKKMILGLLAGSMVIGLYADPMVSPIKVSSAIRLGPGATQVVYLDTNKLPTIGPRYSYTISCVIDQISTPSTNSVNSYYSYTGMGNLATLALSGPNGEIPVSKSGGLLQELEVNGSYSLVARLVDISTKDPVGTMTIKNADGKGSFTVEACNAIPQLSNSNSALSVNHSSFVAYQNSQGSSFTVTNVGNTSVNGIAVNNVPAGVHVTNGCSSLGVGNSCSFNIDADSSSPLGTSSLSLVGNGINPIPLTLQIQAENQGPTATTLGISPDSVLVAKGSSETVTLTNEGSNAVNGNLVIGGLGGFNNNDVSVAPDMSCMNLGAHSSCPVVISADNTSGYYSSVPISISSSNSVNSVNVGVSVGSSGLSLDTDQYGLELGGSIVIEVHNNSGLTANNVTGINLPNGVTSSVCSTLLSGESCNITLSADSNAAIGTHQIEIGGDNTSNNPSVDLDVAAVTLSFSGGLVYVPANGSTTLELHNNSSQTTAHNVSLGNLPTGVTASSCDIVPNGSCTITLTGNTAAVTTVPVGFTIIGDNVADLNEQMMVESAGITLSQVPLTFTGPGTVLFTVTNNSHFDVSNIQTQLNGVTGISISNDSCGSGLGGVTSQSQASSCSFDVTATSSAVVTSGSNLTVTGTSAGQSLSEQSAVSLASPTVVVNNNQAIVLPYLNGAQILIPVQVVGGGFALQNPQFDLVIGSGQQSNVSVSLVDANNPNNPCPSVLGAGSSCDVVVKNNADLNPSDPEGDGQLTIRGDNLTGVNTSVDVIGGAQITYISQSNPNYSQYYAAKIQGPRYGVIDVKNIGEGTDPSVDIKNIAWLGSDPTMSIVNASSNASAYGSYNECSTTAGAGKVDSLGVGQECIIVLYSDPTDPGAKTASLKISAGSPLFDTSRTFNLTNTTYLYAGGAFTQAGGNTANFIAKWDGTSWSALGSGMNAQVMNLKIDQAGNIYAGGIFTTAGGSNANRIAKWNGTSWSALGSGMNNFVFGLTIDQAGNVYAGGDFTIAGTSNANHIAKWNGTSWSALGSGMNDWVFGLTIDQAGNVYAGGDFTIAGTSNANRIAKWNGTSWSALGSGMNNFVFGLTIDQAGNVYAGGDFTIAGTSNANHIAKWNGTSWSALGSGMNDWVFGLTIDQAGNVYAGGDFTIAGTSNANHIAKWNGTSWSALGSGMNSRVNGLTIDQAGNVYAGGWFTSPANRIAKWNGSSWLALGSGMNDQVFGG